MTPYIAVVLTLLSVLPGVYLRYIPFRYMLTPDKRRRLMRVYGAVFVLCLLPMLWIVSLDGTYSLTQMKWYETVNWIPFFLVNLRVFRGVLPQQIFVLGMESVFLITGYTVVTVLFLRLVPGFTFEDYIIPFLFAATLFMTAAVPFVRPFFVGVFRLRMEGGGIHRFWRLICFVPCFFACTDMFYINYGGEVLVAEDFLLPRLLNLAAAVFLGGAIYVASDIVDRYVYTLRHYDSVKHQWELLRDHAQNLEQSQSQIAIIRHDRRHYLGLLSECLQKGSTEEALALIRHITRKLNETKVERYCQNTMINAVFSRFAAKAREDHITLTVDAVVPKNIDPEMDLAIVLSNVLENAGRASLALPDEERRIAVRIQDLGSTLRILVENRFDGEVVFGKDGLPQTGRTGHGIGMKSLREFCRNHDAAIRCTYRDGLFRLQLVCPYTKNLGGTIHLKRTNTPENAESAGKSGT